MLSDLFTNFGFQLLYFVGIISVLGLVIWQLNKTLFRLLGYKWGKRFFRSTGFIGVPIHELGHAFFCVIFFHKIKEIKLFQPNSKDGTLGYVHHTYKKKSIYQQIGNFFIGIGPLLFGSAAIIGLMYLLMPNASQVQIHGGTEISQYWETLWEIFIAIFDYHNLTSGAWWLFIILACPIAMHMDLSLADIKGCIRGLVYIIVIVFLMNLILCLINPNWAKAVTAGCLWLSVSVVSFMVIAVLLLVVLVVFVALMRFIKRKIIKQKKVKIVVAPEKTESPVN